MIHLLLNESKGCTEPESVSSSFTEDRAFVRVFEVVVALEGIGGFSSERDAILLIFSV
jgi:hypothetical protein